VQVMSVLRLALKGYVRVELCIARSGS
jgi:hypothetical protein